MLSNTNAIIIKNAEAKRSFSYNSDLEQIDQLNQISHQVGLSRNKLYEYIISTFLRTNPTEITMSLIPNFQNTTISIPMDLFNQLFQFEKSIPQLGLMRSVIIRGAIHTFLKTIKTDPTAFNTWIMDQYSYYRNGKGINIFHPETFYASIPQLSVKP